MNSLINKNKVTMKSKLHRILTAAFMLLLFATNLRANDIVVSNISLTDENTTDKFVMVQFDLSWENSWRISSGPANWDAAWVFVKYRITAANGGDDLWKHAWLSITDGHHQVSINNGVPATINIGTTEISSTERGMGAFIFRSDNGSGANNWQNVQLRWNYGANGVADDATVDVQVFAIEMVYVPQGAFAAGSGGIEFSAFTLTTINTGNATTAPTGTGGFNGSAQGGYPTGQAAPANASYPNGYNAFYMQKYSITQQQYVDFLNTLTSTQAGNRYSSSSTGFRYGITVSGGVYSTTNPYVACNFLSWMDGAAYSDWAGLRPMTELEFEKASRGAIAPVANEYAWGNTFATAADNITNPGAANETTNTSGANAVFANQANVQGPMRVGVFAQSATTREQSGASYYGIMELSGNLWERPVTIGNATGRAFTGVHGDGVLSANGHANQTAWPGLSSGQVTGATGSGFRGGGWAGGASDLRASDRYIAAGTDSGRFGDYGFRGVRVVP